MMDLLCQADRCRRPSSANLCQLHRDELVDALRELARNLLDELDIQRRRQNVGRKLAGGGGGFARPLLFNPEAADLAFTAASTLTAWETSLHEANTHLQRLGAEASPGDRAGWLSLFGGLLADLPDAGQCHGEVLYTTHQITRLIDNAPARKYLGICSAPTESGPCGHDVYARPEASFARCLGCGTEHDVVLRRAVLLDAVQEQCATVADVVMGLPSLLGQEVKKNTLRGWLRTGALVAVGQNGKGLALVRIGDVIELAMSTPTRNRKPKAVVVAQIDLCA